MFAIGSHAELKSSIDSIGACIALFELDMEQTIRLISANRHYEEIGGMPVEEMIGGKLNEIFPRYLETQITEQIALCIENQLPSEDEFVIDREGQIRWWRIISSPVFSKLGRVKRIMNTCIEITEKKQLELSLESSHSRFEAVVATAYDGIVSIDEDRTIKLINQAGLDIFGYTRAELVGQLLEQLLPQRYRDKHQAYVATFAESPVHSRPMKSRAAVRGLRKDGSEFPVEVTISKIKVGPNLEMTAVVRDISERSRLIEELQKAAIEDGLTGIYNRRHLERIIRRELLRCERFGGDMALILFDIDRFKQINDSLGHEAGDLALQEITQLAQESIRDVDVFGRWGGDEFLVILPGTKAEDAATWADRLRRQIEGHPLEYNQQPIPLRCSFGVADNHKGLVSVDLFVSLADQALYQAKQAGRNMVCCHPGAETEVE